MKCQNYGCRKKVTKVYIATVSRRTLFYCDLCMTETIQDFKIKFREQFKSDRSFRSYCRSVDSRVGVIDKGVLA